MKKINFKNLSNDEILTRDELKGIVGGYDGSGGGYGSGDDGSGGGGGNDWDDGSGDYDRGDDGSGEPAGHHTCKVYISETGETLTKSADNRKESEMRGLKAWAEFYQISGRSVDCYFTQIFYT